MSHALSRVCAGSGARPPPPRRAPARPARRPLWALCRVLQPGEWATFAGCATDGNHVTGLRTCDPAVTTGG
ncbi:hypothetical protein [Streptomyces roseolus]|uniref:hypothetical protein n=1 Tax=Streptomyces TaxID=1883 RepID=UPI0036EB4E2C